MAELKIVRGNFSVPFATGWTRSQRNRFVRRVQYIALTPSRRQIATVSRKRFPKRTGNLRRNFKGIPPKKIFESPNRYRALQFKMVPYTHLQKMAYAMFLETLDENAPQIIANAFAQAVEESFRL